MQNEQDPKPVTATETTDRRDVVKKLGKFAAYAAPFTTLAFTQKAAAATGGGPPKGNALAAQARHR